MNRSSQSLKSSNKSIDHHPHNRFPLPVTLLFMLVASILLGYLLLVLAYMLPTKSMYAHIEASLPMYNQEGQYPDVIYGNPATGLDNWTDTLMLGAATYQSERPAMDALLVPRIKYGPLEPLDNLNQIVSHRGSEEGGTLSYYPRYWHGYLILLKPLIALFTPSQIRIGNTVMQFLLSAITMFLLFKQIGLQQALAFFAVLSVINPMTTGKAFQYSSIFYISMLSIIYILTKGKNLMEGNRVMIFFFMIGILTAYFDLLTYPIASLGLPLLTFLTLKGHEEAPDQKKLKDMLLTMLTLSAIWALGYATMWSAKWVLATIFTDENVFTDALNQAVFRMNGQITKNEMTNMGAVAITRNLELLLHTPVLVELGLFILALTVLHMQRKEKIKVPALYILLPLLLIALYPIIWDGILKNHSLIHYWMTYQNLSMLTFSLFLLIAEV